MVTKAVPSRATAIPRIMRPVTSSWRKSVPQRIPKAGMIKVTVVAAVAPLRLSRPKKRMKATAVQRTPRARVLARAPRPGRAGGGKSRTRGRRMREAARRLPAETARGERWESLVRV